MNFGYYKPWFLKITLKLIKIIYFLQEAKKNKNIELVYNNHLQIKK